VYDPAVHLFTPPDCLQPRSQRGKDADHPIRVAANGVGRAETENQSSFPSGTGEDVFAGHPPLGPLFRK
jgi:hypothetical protein